MTNTSIRVKRNPSPFLLKPVGKNYLWGGTRLNDDFAKGIDIFPLAETWECSTHPHGISVVGSGEYIGKPLSEIVLDHPEFLGKHSEGLTDLPVLIKLIDAKSDLSVQVHPDDEYAFQNENGQKGKTEFWYILDATKDAHIIYGLHHNCDREAIEKSLQDGTFEYYLQKVRVNPDDLFLINAGTIHAIGAGTLVAEIQQSSDLTYRLYDYNRMDRSGVKRELHLKKALDVANLNAMAEPQQPMRVLNYSPGCAIELLVRCQYFQIERILINTERIKSMVSFKTDDLSFKIFICVGGCGMLFFGDQSLPFFKGDCIFIPANSEELKLHGKAQMLSVSC